MDEAAPTPIAYREERQVLHEEEAKEDRRRDGKVQACGGPCGSPRPGLLSLLGVFQANLQRRIDSNIT